MDLWRNADIFLMFQCVRNIKDRVNKLLELSGATDIPGSSKNKSVPFILENKSVPFIVPFIL